MTASSPVRPPNYWSHLLIAAAWDMQATPPGRPGVLHSGEQAAGYPGAPRWRLLRDALDGVKDGVIEDPTQCHFDPAKLLCKAAESDQCLTAPQVAALQKIYAGPRDSKNKQVFPGYSPGGEAESGGWAPWITGQDREKALMFAFGTQYFKNMVFDNAAWDYHTFVVDRDGKTADDKTAKILNATDPNLEPFKKRGGKLILYHGWSDAAIPAQNVINYYQSVVGRMGPQDTASFVRLYMVPGMEHCAGGAGPDVFGASGVAQGDAQHDIATDLERWVESGTAHKEIIATKYKNPSNPAEGVVRTRPLCPYPQVARWKRSGNTDDAANFACVNHSSATSTSPNR